MKIALSKIQPNPFRHMGRYPIKRDKIDALKKSIKDTSFWANIVGRSDGNGGVELAYGHHRLVALRELFDPSTKIDLIVRKLDDTSMAKIMANENMDEWGSQADVEQETIRAIIEGFAEGLIDLPGIAKTRNQTELRYAPHFRLGPTKGADRSHPYTTAMLCEFLGWNVEKVRTALNALNLIEQGGVHESEYIGLSTTQARALTLETRRSLDRAEQLAQIAENSGRVKRAKAVRTAGKAEAKQVSKALSKGFKDKEITKRTASDIARHVRTEGHKSITPPDINPLALTLAQRIDNFLNPHSTHGKRIAEVVKFKKYLDKDRSNDLLVSFRALRDYADKHIRTLEKPALRKIK